MKQLLLGLSLLLCTVYAETPEKFLARAGVEGEQYETLRVMLHVLEEFTIEERTIMYLYLESLEAKALDKDEDFCFECVALKNAQ